MSTILHRQGKLLRVFPAILLMLTASVLLSGTASAALGGVTIQGSVRLDVNRNGVVDIVDTPSANITILLLDGNNHTIGSTTTDSAGAFSFSDWAPGTYRLRILACAYCDIKAFPGNNAIRLDDTTIYVNATGLWGVYSNNVFLLCEDVGRICGRVVNDLNCDGGIDTTDPGVSGVLLTLRNGSNVAIDTRTSNSGGYYCFTDLTPGIYTVVETLPAGFAASNAIAGPGGTKVNSTTIRVDATTPGAEYYANFLLCGSVEIGAQVYIDTNRNGALDVGEPPRSGVTVQLLNSSSAVVSAAVTNSSGAVVFLVPPGNYRLHEIIPAGYNASNAIPGPSATRVDSSNISVAATTLGVRYTPNKFLLFANVEICAQVYVDTNRNGAFDTGEPPRSGVTIQLLDSNSGVVASAVTNSSGAVEFQVVPGNYRLREIVPNGYNASNAFAGPGGTRIDSTTIAIAATTAGQSYCPNKFLLCAFVNIGAQVYVDSNRNGALDSGEPPLAGVTVQLLNSSSVVVNSAVTNSSGAVSFRMPPGNYRLHEIVPAGYNASNAIPGPSATRVDSSNISVAATTPGVSYMPNKFLLCLLPVKISGRVVSDLNGDGAMGSTEPGIGGVLLTLRDAANVVVATKTTNSEGYYSFTDLVPGTYTVVETVPAGYVASNAIPGSGGVKVTLTTIRIGATTAGSEYYANFLLCGHVDICAQVYVDTNRNGLLDTGEPPRPGVTIQLLNSSSVVVASAITNSSGVAEFQVLAGTYRLKEVVPNGYNASNAIPGPGGVRIDRTNISIVATTPGQSYCPNKFLLCAYVDIGAQVYIDINRNGALDTGEPPLGGVTVQLLNSSLAVVASAVTSSSGAVSFRVPPGSYRLKEIVPAGYDASNAIAGPSATRIDSSNISVAATTPGVSYTPNKFLLKTVPCIALRKSANVSQVLPGGRVTYIYTVTNTGTAGLVNVKVVDNNGTSDYDGDDFTVGTIASLDPGQSMNLTATVIPPIKLCAKDTGVAVGTLVTNILPDGSIKVTFTQAAGVNDNTYGVNSEGWGSRIHRFSDLVNSDQATFSFTDTGGRVVLAFKLDYITKASSATFPSGQVLYPSGYGTLGVNGGDGGMKTGNRAYVLYATTSLTQNLNQSPEYYGVIVDSPASGSTLAPKWDKVMRYTVVVDKAAFGIAGFGKVTVIDQHNSPQKCPSFIPIICDNCVTNTAVVTGEDSAGTAVRASATATVLVTSNAQ